MKTNKPNGASNRDRSYWEAPRSAMKIEAHIEEIDFDNAEPVRRPARNTRLARALRNRRVRGGAAIGCMAVLFAAVSVGPLASSTPTPSASPSASHTAVATDPIAFVSPDGSELISPSAADTLIPDPTETPFVYVRPTGTPAPIATPDPTPTPFSTGKWPVTLHANNTPFSDMTVGPDGTVYLQGIGALDKSGKTKTAFLNASDGTPIVPTAFGPDGTAYVAVSQGADQSSGAALPDLLYAYGTNGKVRPGWPVEVPAQSSLAFGPAGSIYSIGSANGSETKVVVLTPAGKTKTSWSISYPGNWNCGWVLRPDGTLFYGYAPAVGASDCAIGVFGPTGQALAKSPTRGWSRIELSPTGAVVACGYDMEPYSNLVVARSRVAVIGTDGQPVAGWPITFDGAVSAPSFSADGTMNFTQLGLGTAPSKVIAVDASGVVKPGWPLRLPAGYAPMASYSGIPDAPVPGSNGTIYVDAVNKDWMGFVMAYDAAGVVVPGWPYQLPQAFTNFNVGSQGATYNPGPMFLKSKTGTSLLYLVLDGRIVALAADGTVAPGWPFTLSGANSGGVWTAVEPTPDGGLVVVAYLQADPSAKAADDSWIVYDLTPAGALSK